MEKKQKYLIMILLVAFSLIAFGRIAGNDFVNHDDPRLITTHSMVTSGFNADSIKWALTNASEEYWHPLTSLSLILDWQLFGENASGHHLVSLFWHIGAVLLLFLFLNKTTKQIWPSAFAAALFALHPLRVESVAWASERKDVLSLFFSMATLYAYAFYVQDRKISKYLLCILMFVFALMSKPMVVTLPCVLLLLDYWPLRRWPNVPMTPIAATSNASKPSKKGGKKVVAGQIMIPAVATSGQQVFKKLLMEKVPFFLLSMISSIFLIIGLRSAGALHTLEELLLSDRIINSVVSYAVYLRKFFWPMDLAVFYPYQSTYPSWQLFGAASVLTGITIAVLFFWKKAPFIFVGWFWYLGTLFPVIGLLQTGIQTKADRYTYLPSIGIGIMLIWGILYLVPKEKIRKIVLFPAAVIVSIALTILTWQQCGHWKNSVSLWSHAANVTEDNYFAHNTLGALFLAENKNDEAIVHLQAAIQINPFWDNAYNMLGVAQVAQGEKEKAIAHFLEAIKVNPYNDNAQLNLGISLEEQGKNEEAKSYYHKAMEINPANAGTHYHLASLLMKQGEKKQAEHHYREAVKSNPDYFAARYDLAGILANQGKIGEAIEHFREAARINDSSFQALNNLGVLLEKQQQHEEAIHYYRLAMPLEPNNPGLHFNLGVALGNKGDFSQAIHHFSRAVELKPDYEEALRALKLARELQRQNQ
jgi:tetratricopeptide (TPR) repeat protein